MLEQLQPGAVQARKGAALRRDTGAVLVKLGRTGALNKK